MQGDSKQLIKLQEIVLKGDMEEIYSKYKIPVLYEVDLTDVTQEKDLPHLLEQLKIEHHYPPDSDITQDFAGTIFNKLEKCQYLIDN